MAIGRLLSAMDQTKRGGSLGGVRRMGIADCGLVKALFCLSLSYPFRCSERGANESEPG